MRPRPGFVASALMIMMIAALAMTGGCKKYDEGPGCTNTCAYAEDHECDDGGEGASFSVCDYGTDCEDCGPRSVDGDNDNNNTNETTWIDGVPLPTEAAAPDPDDPTNQAYAGGGPCPVGMYCNEDMTSYYFVFGTDSDCMITIPGGCDLRAGYRCVEQDEENEFGRREASHMEFQVEGEVPQLGCPHSGSAPGYRVGDTVVFCGDCDTCAYTGATIRCCTQIPARIELPDECEHPSWVFSSWQEVDGERAYCHESVQGCFVPPCLPDIDAICEGTEVTDVSAECSAAIEAAREAMMPYLDIYTDVGQRGCIQDCINAMMDCMESSNCDGSVPCQDNSTTCVTNCLI